MSQQRPKQNGYAIAIGHCKIDEFDTVKRLFYV